MLKELGVPRRKKFPIAKIIFLSIFFLVGFISILYFFNLEKYALKGPSGVVKLILDSGLKSDNGRTNVLLLGIGGKGHDGPDLTDTIILASIDKGEKDVVLVSIPRDLWVPDSTAKINHIYAQAQERDGNGLEEAKKAVGILLGVPVHYAFRIDFNGFIKAVDQVEGLSVEVEDSFTDPKYPISGKEDDLCGLTIEKQDINGAQVQVVKDATGSATPLSEVNEQNDPFTCRYETITYVQGPTLMDGTTALKFVRSRHGTNGQGSDFARSARQQKVLLAFREKVLSSQTLTNPKTIISLFGTFGDSIDTDIEDDDISLFAKLGTQVEAEKVRRVVLSASEEDSRLEFGLPRDYGGQSVLVPKNGSWTELGEYIQSELFKLEEQ